jgi:hypothetical protein
MCPQAERNRRQKWLPIGDNRLHRIESFNALSTTNLASIPYGEIKVASVTG